VKQAKFDKNLACFSVCL